MSVSESLQISPDFKLNAFGILRVLIGLLLLTAGLMKAYQISTIPTLGTGFFHARWVNIAIVEFEILLAIWLFTGLLPRITWLVTVICFVVFTGVSVFKFASGETSCGCFGAASTPPLYVAIMDAMVVGLLVVFRPKVNWTYGLKAAKKQVLNYCLIVVPVGCFLFWSISQVEFHQLREIGQVLERGSIVKLEPQTWVDKTFPLRDYCDIGQQITVGNWLVMLRRTGCSDCYDAGEFIANLALEKNDSFAILEMNSVQEKFDFGEVKPLVGILSQKISWFAETPVVLELKDGIVKQVLLREDLKRMRSADVQQPFILGSIVPSEVVK